MGEDVPSFGADGHAESDFPGAFGDGDVHDVHDADAADEEGDACNAGEEHRHHVGRGVHHAAEFLLRSDVEVVGITGTEFVVAAEQSRDFLFRFFGLFLAQGGAVDALEVGDGEHPFLDGGVGGEDEVVLVHAHGVVAFGGQYAHDLERDFPEPYHLSDGVFAIGEKVVHDGFSDHAYFGGVKDVFFGEHFPFADRVFADVQIVGVHPVDGGGVVVCPEYRLPAAVDGGGASGDVTGFADDGVVVLQFEAFHFRRIQAHSAAAVGTGVYHDHVGAHFGNLCPYAPFGTLPDGEHGDDGCHSDDNAEHGEESPHFVVAEGADGYPEEVGVIHVVTVFSLLVWESILRWSGRKRCVRCGCPTPRARL